MGERGEAGAWRRKSQTPKIQTPNKHQNSDGVVEVWFDIVF
jgi:hypothetical protein